MKRKINLNKNENWIKIKDGNKREGKEEERDADDQCCADMLLRGVFHRLYAWVSLNILIFFSFQRLTVFKNQEIKKRL